MRYIINEYTLWLSLRIRGRVEKFESTLKCNFISFFLFDRSPCNHTVLIVGWWCSSPWTDSTGTLDAVPLIVDATVTQSNNTPRYPWSHSPSFCPGPPPPPARTYTISSSSGTQSISFQRWFIRPPSKTVNPHWPLSYTPDWLTANWYLVGRPWLPAQSTGTWELASLDLCGW